MNSPLGMMTRGTQGNSRSRRPHSRSIDPPKVDLSHKKRKYLRDLRDGNKILTTLLFQIIWLSQHSSNNSPTDVHRKYIQFIKVNCRFPHVLQHRQRGHIWRTHRGLHMYSTGTPNTLTQKKSSVTIPSIL